MRKTTLCGTVLAGIALASLNAMAGPTVVGVGSYALGSGGTGAAELSGLTWAGGGQFYAVSDSAARLYPLTVGVDPTTGAVLSAVLSPHLPLGAGSDLEGVAYDPGAGMVYASDEVGPAVREYRLTDGAVLGTVTVPAVYANQRSNRGLESLARSAGDGSLWTANEEALSVDGPLSTVGAGTVVRLQRFDSALGAAGQWAYVTDGIAGDIPFVSGERSGVSDLAVLPTGEVLVLEREFGLGVSLFRSRIYRADFTGATDTSALPQLDGAAYTPLGKELLWEGNFLTDNFEGLALGPALAGGWHSLLMISDDGGGLGQSLYALRVRFDAPAVPEPGGLGLLAGALLWTRIRRR